MVRRYYGKSSFATKENPFRSEGFLHDGAIFRTGGGTLALSILPPFLRTLLVTDGTVTKILEAYFWEPISVDTLRQEVVTTEQAVPWIDVNPKTDVLVRQARLRGIHSDNVYATAFSVIRPERIAASFRQRLIDREIGIGVLIRDSGLESYRELMEVGIEPRRPIPAAEKLHLEDRIFRTYRIIIGEAPVILITESFPLSCYADTLRDQS